MRALLFPAYDPVAEAELRRLSPLDALQRLLATDSLFGHDVGSFLTWLERLPAYTASYASTEEAVRLTRSLGQSESSWEES